jgi:ubiquinone/menaquinone biosynthesis C-methylase UbiE
MTSDKELEHRRYDDRAQQLLSQQNTDDRLGSAVLPAYLRKPYLDYEEKLQKNITGSHFKILEIGAGTGAFTEILLKTGASVCATDISTSSLDFLKKKFSRYNNLKTQVADMESLPFEDGSFDIVTSAGSLSYGNNKLVLNELRRVLKNNGKFICVDSLNHNIVYRFNRWIHYLRGNRTLSTLQRMPTLSLINDYGKSFGDSEATFYGSISWIVPLLKPVLRVEKTARFLDWFDRIITVKMSAFKFVMIAQKTTDHC